MFGYVRYDLPNLFIKDFALYKALYCGLCKGIGKSCGQAARIGLSYDLTFFSAMLHNIAGQDIRIERQNCFEHAIRKRPIAAVDGLTEQLGALNTVLVYYKLTDDIADGGRGRGRRLWFKKGFRRAKRKYPEMVSVVTEYMLEQAEAERSCVASPDMAAEPSALLMRRLSDLLLGDKATEATGGLFYDAGKWVYLIDALDDYDKDVKKKRYNPFFLSYGYGTRAELLREQKGDIGFLFDTLFYSMREHLANIKFYFNRDLTDNIVLRGLPAETERVMRGEAGKKMPVKV